MDPLFYMQRYWGSDDSDVEDSAHKENVKSDVQRVLAKRSLSSSSSKAASNELSERRDAHPVKRKLSLESRDSSQEAERCSRVQSLADETAGKSEQSASLSPKKKRKKKKPTKGQDGTLKSESTVELLESKTVDNCGRTSETKNEVHHPAKVDEPDYGSENVSSEPEETSEAYPVIKDVTKKQEKVSRILPDWLSKPTFIQEDLEGQETPISELDFLDEVTKENLRKCDIHYLFPVQFKVIPWLLRSSSKRYLIKPSDICVSAPTGSGKTLAFVIPIVQTLKTRVVQRIRAVVALPVGELAVQVYKVFQQFCKGTDLKTLLVIGQKSFQQEQEQLVKASSRGFMSLADIIVCTPGRLTDHISRTPGFSLAHLQYLVIDEADRMMEEIQQGWLKKVEDAVYKRGNSSGCSCFGIEDLYGKLRAGPSSPCSFCHVSDPLQKLLYSATLSQDPEKLHELSLYRPHLFTSSCKIVESGSEPKNAVTGELFIGKYVTPKGLLEQYVVCEASIKPLVICTLIKRSKYRRVLCFTRSLEHSHRLYLVLNDMLELHVRELSSNLRPVQRKIVLDQFANGKVGVLVCSDIMARGMDIEDVDCVLSYDAPLFITKYIHRVGRTARAGKEGVAITLLEDSEVQQFKRMLKDGGKSPPVKLELSEEELTPLEENFKKALASASEAIRKEKAKESLLKRTCKRRTTNYKAFKNRRKLKWSGSK